MKLSSKDKLRNAAKALFWKFSIKKVTVEEICETAGLSKMTFYRNFKSKPDIVISVLDEFIEKALDDSRKIMYSKQSFFDKAQQIILLKTNQVKGASFEFIKELAAVDDNELRDYFFEKKAAMSTEILNWFSAAQKNGDIRADLDLRMLDFYTDMISRMLSDPHLLQIYKTTENLIKELNTFFFYGISPQSKENSAQK